MTLSASTILTAVCAALLGFTPGARAEVTLPNIIGSNMVLQRDMELAVWGWAEPNEEVTVQLAGVTARSAANAKGEWRVKLPAQRAGGPHDLTVRGKNTIVLSNVLIGEVWLGSGQSNMEMTVFHTSSRTKDDVASAKYPRIRFFNVAPKKTAQATPQTNVDPSVVWTECTPETAFKFSAVAYYFGRYLQKELDVPVGLINASWGGTRIEPWIPPAGFALIDDPKTKEAYARPPTLPVNHATPCALFNGNINPLIAFPIRGVLWYQGESNLGEGMAYTQKMEALIKSWRAAWGQGDFPFFYVQLAPYRTKLFGPGNVERVELMPEMWESQAAVMRRVPGTGMCVTTDIGNLTDIHPRNKEEVSRRLWLWAQATVYGHKDVVCSGPIYKSMKVEGSKIRLQFDYAQQGLASRDGQPLNWFQIAGEDGKFVDAAAVIEGASVVVSNASALNPTAVRFGWDQCAEPNLINKAGLPASPFRTNPPPARPIVVQ